jgi:hypothetical protein
MRDYIFSLHVSPLTGMAEPAYIQFYLFRKSIIFIPDRSPKGRPQYANRQYTYNYLTQYTVIDFLKFASPLANQ